jgi:hypothetical protein
MLKLQNKHHKARIEQDKELYERQIKIFDAQIDGIVYDLYGLTQGESTVPFSSYFSDMDLHGFTPI